MREMLTEVVRYVATTQALGDLLPMITFVAEQAAAIVETDPEVVPEVKAAVEHLMEAGKAIERAHSFAAARIDVRMQGE